MDTARMDVEFNHILDNNTFGIGTIW